MGCFIGPLRKRRSTSSRNFGPHSGHTRRHRRSRTHRCLDRRITRAGPFRAAHQLRAGTVHDEVLRWRQRPANRHLARHHLSRLLFSSAGGETYLYSSASCLTKRLTWAQTRWPSINIAVCRLRFYVTARPDTQRAKLAPVRLRATAARLGTPRYASGCGRSSQLTEGNLIREESVDGRAADCSSSSPRCARSRHRPASGTPQGAAAPTSARTLRAATACASSRRRAPTRDGAARRRAAGLLSHAGRNPAASSKHCIFASPLTSACQEPE